MKTQVYMVRHCESEGNACRRSHAQFDGFVTRKGLKQAEALAKRFADIHVDAIYSSDAYRARMTAAPLAAQKGLRVQYRMLLREYTIGTWEGASIGYTARTFPDLWDIWTTRPYDNTIPGCDRFPVVADRGYEIIRRMAEEHPGGTVVAITHTCTLNCTLSKVLGKDISYYSQIPGGDNTAVTLIEVDEDGSMEVKYMADTSHLPDELLRKNYTGRSIATNMAFEYGLTAADRAGRFTEMAGELAKQYPALYSVDDLTAKADAALQQGKRYVVYGMLLERNCGLAVVSRRPDMGEDYGQLDALYVAPDLRFKGYIEQMFGEALDMVRRDGCRYLLVRTNGDEHLQYLVDRFCFEPVEGQENLYAVRITVPGAEGPIY